MTFLRWKGPVQFQEPCRSLGTWWLLKIPFAGLMWFMLLVQLLHNHCEILPVVSVFGSCGSGSEVGGI